MRHGCFEFGADNVIVCSIDKVDGFLQFVTLGNASEATHLKDITEAERDRLKDEAKALHFQESISYRDIGKRLGISKTTVERYCKS